MTRDDLILGVETYRDMWIKQLIENNELGFDDPYVDNINSTLNNLVKFIEEHYDD